MGCPQLVASSVPVAGSSRPEHANALRLVAMFRECDVQFVRQPENPHDANAIRVIARIHSDGRSESHPIGYVPRELAAIIAPYMDDGCRFAGVLREVILPSGRSHAGARLRIWSDVSPASQSWSDRLASDIGR